MKEKKERRKLKLTETLFSPALFKQSWKANGLMWGIITACTCGILALVMLVSGSGSIADLTNSVTETIVRQTLDSQIQNTALTYYNVGSNGMQSFDEGFLEYYGKAYKADPFNPEDPSDMMNKVTKYTTEATKNATMYTLTYAAITVTQEMYPGLEISYDSTSEFYQRWYEIYGVMQFTINVGGIVDSQYDSYLEGSAPEQYDIQTLVSKISSNDYAAFLKDEKATDALTYVHGDERKTYQNNRSLYGVGILLGGNMTQENYIDTIVSGLESFGIDKETYLSYGYDFAYIRKIADSAMVTYQARVDYEVSQLDPSSFDTTEAYQEAVLKIETDIKNDIASTILTQLPENVSNALEEIGELDLYGMVIGTIFYKVAGLLLPLIFVIMVSNNLIAGQVDTGSMAYVLSTSTKRSQVVFTQAMFMVSALFLMTLATSLVGSLCLLFVDLSRTALNFTTLLYMNIGSFLSLFAIAGINFLTSCWFDRSKRSMAIGGGISMFFLVATMLGLFGSPVVPSVIRMDPLNAFNYVSILSLFDVVDILGGGITWVYELLALLAIGLVGFILGSWRFKKKDLPL